MSTLGHWCLSERCPLQKTAWWENVVEEKVQLSNDADAGAVLPVHRDHRLDVLAKRTQFRKRDPSSHILAR
jgi:hypothetical protein